MKLNTSLPYQRVYILKSHILTLRILLLIKEYGIQNWKKFVKLVWKSVAFTAPETKYIIVILSVF